MPAILFEQQVSEINNGTSDVIKFLEDFGSATGIPALAISRALYSAAIFGYIYNVAIPEYQNIRKNSGKTHEQKIGVKKGREDEEEKVEGEIYISIPQVEKNAKEFEQSYSKELARIIIHGSLHLLNYDDSTPDAKITMTEKENFLLKKTDWKNLI